MHIENPKPIRTHYERLFVGSMGRFRPPCLTISSGLARTMENMWSDESRRELWTDAGGNMAVLRDFLDFIVMLKVEIEGKDATHLVGKLKKQMLNRVSCVDTCLSFWEWPLVELKKLDVH